MIDTNIMPVKTVTAIRLTVQSTWVEGIGALKQSLNEQMYRGIKMQEGFIGVECSYKGIDFCIPYSLIETMVYAQ